MNDIASVLVYDRDALKTTYGEIIRGQFDGEPVITLTAVKLSNNEPILQLSMTYNIAYSIASDILKFLEREAGNGPTVQD